MSDILYSANGIKFGYHPDKRVIDGIDLRVTPGEIVALIGPNGAGKSTLLKLLIRLIKPRSGDIEFEGVPLESRSQRDLARKVAYLPQESEIHFPFTVGEVVMLGRWPHSGGTFFDNESDRAAAGKAMDMVGIGDWSARLVTELSGGERARVLLAKAIATEPRCLLLDEPVSQLDLKYRTDAYSLLKRLADKGAAVVVVAHDIGAVSRWADRMILLAHGKVISEGRIDKVLSEQNLKHAYGIDVKVISDGNDRAVFASLRNIGKDK